MADLSFDDIRCKIREQMEATYKAQAGPMECAPTSPWIVEVYPAYFICEKEKGKLYKISYKVKGDDVTINTDSAMEVKEEYVPAQQSSLDLYMAERYPGFPSWSSVDKSKLPSGAFLVVSDPDNRSTWKLPYKYRDATGKLVVHPKGVLAAWQAIVGAHTGIAMKIATSLKAKMRVFYQKYWGDDDD